MRETSETSDTVLLVRPAAFGFHAEAARSNAFAAGSDDPEVSARAVAEFDGLRAALEQAGVTCLVLDDTAEPARPDAVFPNNWVSFHGDGTMIVYPMANELRRLERRPDELRALVSDGGFAVERVIDLSRLEQDGEFLEGTGSLVLDRPRARAFACRSPRTTAGAVRAFERATGWSVTLFDAADRRGRAIYHSNVMLSLGARFALVCVEAIAPGERDRILAALSEGRELISVTYDQMERFACNAIELRSRSGAPLVAMSTTARDSFTAEQLDAFGCPIVAVPIPTIERVGGGSVRCMIAELFLPA